jgi:hypothetical protein
MYYSKDVPKYQYVNAKYLPTKEVGHTTKTCKPEDYLFLTKLETEAFIRQLKRIVTSKHKKILLRFELETLTIDGVTTHYFRIGYIPDNPESMLQLKLVNPPPQEWDKEAIVYLSQRNYIFLENK